MVKVVIWNSWMMDQLRSIAYPGDFKKYYMDRVLAEVFKTASTDKLGGPVEIYFIDNHYSNFDYLNYKELHNQLRKYFSTVVFYSDNRIDSILDPEYFQFYIHDSYVSEDKTHLDKIYNNNIIQWHENKKLFGLYISRPDQHRLAILYEFYKRDLLKYTDCKIGFSRNDLMADEHWRTSAIDLTCKNMEISHFELLDVIDSIPKSDRHYVDKAEHNSIINGTRPVVKLDYEKSIINNNFVIEIVCMSSSTDNVCIMSEKLERVLALGQPFVVVGGAHTYHNLRCVSLKTFDEFWDESWDSITHDRLADKIRSIGETCEYIAKTYTPKEIFLKTKPIVMHNQIQHRESVSHYGTFEQYRRMTTAYKFKTTYDR